jgi:glycosyltransferase involved in cell wall biosynthesis
MKVSILWSRLASYSVAFFKELALTQKCRLQLVYQAASMDAPYPEFDLSFCEDAIVDSPERGSEIGRAVSQFAPDCILMCSWNFAHFMRIARRSRRRGTFVLAGMDNQWRGTPKQWLGVVTAKVHLKPAIDTFLVAGDRQAWFARKLGYDNVLYGFYAAEIDKFEGGPPVSSRAPEFLFIGRLAEEKGLANLLSAYSIYRSEACHPWGLTIAGTGPLQALVENVPGVRYAGFVPPAELPSLMHTVRCFVLPSTREPWGVVLQEAAASGLPIICTYRCGACTAFVRDGLNGLVIPPRVSSIAAALDSIASEPVSRLNSMSSCSRALASTWSPGLLAEYVARSLKARIGVPR